MSRFKALKNGAVAAVAAVAFIAFSASSWGQTPVTGIVTADVAGTSATLVTSTGVNCDVSGVTPCNTAVTVRYAGVMKRVTSLTAGATTYTLIQPVQDVIIHRRDNGFTVDTNRVVGFGEMRVSPTTIPINVNTTTTINVDSAYTDTVENLLKLNALNSGIDNVFANDPTGSNSLSSNNIERIDVLFTPVVAQIASQLTTSAFPLFERGTGDAFRIAPLRGTAGSCAAPTVGAQVTVANGWGSTALYTRQELIARRDPTVGDVDMRPIHSLSQPVSGTVLTLANIGFAVGNTVCGYALFAADSTGTDPTMAGQNSGTTGQTAGGLDLIASLAYFSMVSDMSVAISGLPTSASPGANFTKTGALVCTNVGPGAALSPTCSAAAGTPAGATVGVSNCVASGGSTLAAVAPGGTITCDLTVTMPGTAGGSDTTQTSVGVNGATSATNETNLANNAASAAINVIDALTDSTSTPFGIATSLNVLTNDTNGAAAATTTNVTITQTVAPTAGSSFDPSTGVFSVPNTAAPGTYTVTYQICANPATTPAACDTATATIVVGPAADMSVAITGLPTSASPGAVLTGGSLVCSNSAAATATSPTCTAAAGTPAGATVVLGACTYSAGSSATSVLASGTITCPVTVTMPGTAGGSDTTQTSVGVNGATSATNETNLANNAASAAINVIDALTDSTSTPFGIATSLNVLTNDTNGAAAATTTNVTITQTVAPTAGSSFDPSTGVFSVPNTAAPGTYTVTYQICANPATTPAACDTATATIVVGPAADMSVAITGLPTSASPGAVLTGGSLVCSNSAAATATNPTCTAAAGTPAGATVALGACTYSAGSSATSVLASGTITCPVTVTMPGTAGGSDTTQTSVGVNGATSATNETNLANNAASATINVIDALTDSTSTPFGIATSLSVLTNDTNGAAAATTTNVTITQTVAPTAGSSFDAGTGTFSVPNTAAPGTYTVTYQICANPATTPAACDTATATIVVGPAADMSVAITGLPTSASPGAVLTGGSLVCSNSAAATATSPTCTAAAGTPAGATVVLGACTYSAGSSATSVLASGTITCPVTVTMPGTAGGSDTTQTSVGVNGATSATNETNLANNAASAAINVIDALTDSTSTPFGIATSLSVLTNDTNGAAAATTTNVTITQTVAPTAGSSFDAGTGTFSVPNTAAPGTYTVTYQICANPATTPAACDTATATIVVGPAADMSVAITGLPTSASPGAVLTGGSLVCSNSAAATATSPTCTAAAGTPAGATVVLGACTYSAGSSATSVLASGTITCPVTVTMPGTAGGSDTTQTSVGVNGATSATNETNLANNAASAAINVIDALTDSTSTPFGIATSLSVLTNDTNGAAAATTTNVTITQTVAPTAGSSFDAGTGTFSVPNTAAPGTYTVTYQICANPATTPAACDTATATIVVGPAADMSVAITGLPTSASPGAVLTGGSLVCSNSAAATATSPTCTAAAGTPAGATVVLGACTYSAGSSATSVLASGTITCPVTVTMPGTAGGSDTTQTSVGVNGATSATNETNLANNAASAAINVIDALTDSTSTPFGIATSLNVLTNDTNGAAAATTTNVTITQTVAPTAGSSFDPSTGVFSVPNTAAPGTYTVTYQICANPATTPAACDTATATIVVGPAADMSVAITGLPTSASPGAVLTGGSLVCSNSAAATATSPTCTAAAGTPAGATVVLGACTYSAGSSATSVLASGTITCPVTVTMPGTAGGSDTTQTSVGVNGATSATNETNLANNAASAAINVIDALTDSTSTPFGIAVSLNVLTNDTNGAAAATTTNVTITQTVAPTAGSSFDPSTGVFSVPNTAAPGTYTVTYQICANPATTPAACDTATATIVVGPAADMSVAITGLPTSASPGAVLTGGSLVCSNSAAATATNPTCTAAAGTPAGATVALGACTYSAGSSATSVLASGTITCPITVTMPGTAGGSDTTQTSVGVNGATSATNETNLANNAASAAINVIDALTDSTSTPFGIATSLNVLTNDTNGAAAATTTNVTITQTVAPTAGSSFDPSTGVFSVPNTAAPGTYTVTYQICANPATTPAACDTATATIVVGPAADMSVAITGLPTSASPGAVLTGGSLVCSNSAAATATSPTCTAAAGTPAGATVVLGACTYSAGSSATSVLASGTITCPVTVTMPGTAGGSDTTQTSVGVNGATSATNETNLANNAASAAINVIDALTDSTSTPFGIATSLNVLTNDTNGAAAATTTNVTITQTVAPTAGSSFDPSTGVFSVPNTAAPGTYTVTYQICANPATTPAACDTATATIVVGPAADMSVAITGLPTSASPGAVLTGGSLVCSNSAAATATSPTCTAAAGTPAGATVVLGACTYSAGSSATSVLASGTITCPVTVTMPGTAGGSDTTQTSVGVNGATSATNETNLANNAASAAINVIDALTDSTSTPFGIAVSLNVLTNDTNGAAAATTTNVTITQTVAPTAGSSFDPSTGAFSVPNTAAPGTYTVTYQICANPATTPAACDTATATIVVAAGPTDMGVAITGLPATAGPGAVLTGTLSCTNAVGGASALAPTCTAAAGTPAGATVVVGACVYSAGSSATSVLGGGSITCPITVTMPGTAGGTDTTQTSVGVNGSTSASNDSNPANNAASVTLNLVDALSDSANTPFGTAASVSVLGNDTNGAVPATTANVTVTQTVAPTAGSSFDPATGVFSVPATAAPGTYTVSYQICAKPATVPAACDTATATIVVAGNADMGVAITGLPATVGPGAVLTGTLTCTNATGASTATSPTCTAAPGTPAGAIVTVGACSYSAGSSAAAVLGAGTITCPITVTMPGTAGGSDTTQTSVGINGSTGAASDLNPANNATSVSVNLIDALDDSTNAPYGSGAALSVLANDQSGTGTATAASVTVTQTVAPTAGSSFDAATGVFSVPASALPGTYTVGYQICANPATTPPACDTATATIVVADAPAQIGITKAAGTPVQSSALGFRVPYTMIVMNIGVSPAKNVQVSDDLTTTFVAGNPSITISSAATATAPCTVNPIGFNGASVPRLLAGTDTLTAGQACTVSFTVQVDYPSAAAIPTVAQQNTAVAAVYATPPATPGGASTSVALATGKSTDTTAQPGSLPQTGATPTPTPVLLVPQGGRLLIEKQADKQRAEIGDAVLYRIHVSNLSGFTVRSVTVEDVLPAGFKLIPGTSALQVAGKLPVAVPDANIAGFPGPRLVYKLGDLAAGGDAVLSYRVRIGIGADKGTGINSAFAQGEGVRSATTQVRVDVSGGVFTVQACVVGKVYVDCNQNKVQDAGEPGIPGVRLVLEDGTSITTDENGQYSLCGVRPITHVIKIDTTTAPVGARFGVTSSRNAGDANSLFVDPKNGELVRADFREMSCFPKVIEQVQLRRRLGPVVVPTQQPGKDQPEGILFNSDQHKITRPVQAGGDR